MRLAAVQTQVLQMLDSMWDGHHAMSHEMADLHISPPGKTALNFADFTWLENFVMRT